MILNHLFALSLFFLFFLSYSSGDFLQKLMKWNIFTSRKPADIVSTGEGVQEKNGFDVKRFLYKNGYALGDPETESKLKSKMSKLSEMAKDFTFKQIIKLFQKFYSLEATGELDDATIRKMKQPRCGLPDIAATRKFSKFSLADTKWLKTDLTWRLLNFTKDLGLEKTRELTRRAFQVWADVTPLTFTEACKSCKSDLVIDFARHIHDDEGPEDAFDGQGGTLAHAAPPTDGRIHFDDDETFTDTETGTNYLIVASHEIGHALGLQHSRAAKALMYPYYTYTTNLLQPDDIIGIQSLYGKPKSGQKTTTTVKTTLKASNVKTTTKVTTRTTSILKFNYMIPCWYRYDTIVADSKQNINVIIENDVWLFDSSKKSWNQKDLNQVYPGLKSYVTGGVTCKSGQEYHTLFFHRNEIWIYNGLKLRNGFPIVIKDPRYPISPQSAICKNDILYILKDHLAFEFNITSLKIKDIFEMKAIIPNFDIPIDSAVTVNEQIYLFKGRCVFKYDVKKNILQDAKPLHESWFPCFNYPNPYSSCSNKIIKMSGYTNNEDDDDDDSEHFHRHNYQNHRDHYHQNHQKGHHGHDHHNHNERNPHNHKGHDNHQGNQNRG